MIMMIKAVAVVTCLGLTVGLIHIPHEDTSSLENKKKCSEKICLDKKQEF